MEISLRQRIYLDYLNRHKHVKKTQKQIADHFGVSKPTAHVMVDTLAEKGLVCKLSVSQIVLTELGQQIADEQENDVEEVAKWLVEDMGISSDFAQEEALTLLFSMRSVNAQAVLNRAIQANALRRVSTGTAEFHTLQDGVYSLPATLFAADGTRVSMGDAGINKPIELVVRDRSAALVLTTHSIRYKGLLGRLARGSMARMWICQNDVWSEVKSDNSRWIIPTSAMEVVDQAGGVFGRVPVRVQASCGVMNMPVGQAYLRVEIGRAKRFLSQLLPDIEGT